MKGARIERYGSGHMFESNAGGVNRASEANGLALVGAKPFCASVVMREGL
jgi:hypothetical protein